MELVVLVLVLQQLSLMEFSFPGNVGHVVLGCHGYLGQWALLK